MSKGKRFSDQLEEWLTSDKPKTLAGAQEVFGEKSFAIAFLLLMGIPALPIPTGGITHVFLAPATVLLALEMITARRAIWLPNFMQHRSLGALTQKKALPFLLKRIRWFEKYARPRKAWWIDQAMGRAIIGFMIILFAAGVVFAPPFAGLDTLPALGIVIVALGMLLDDIATVLVGFIVGLTGLGLVILSGLVLKEAVFRFF